MASETKEMLWRLQSQLAAVRGDMFQSRTAEELATKIHTANILLRQFERVHKSLRAEFCQWDRLAGDGKTWISSRLGGGMGASAVPESVIQKFTALRLSTAPSPTTPPYNTVDPSPAAPAEGSSQLPSTKMTSTRTSTESKGRRSAKTADLDRRGGERAC